MTNVYKKGSKVSWKWAGNKVEGMIQEVYHDSVEKKIKGSIIKRNGTKENPAYYISEMGKDAHVLKLGSELQSESWFRYANIKVI